MGLISRVSSRTYRSKFQQKTIKMADKVKALRVASLREESKDSLTAKLAELRKDLAKVLTVINQTRKAELQKLYRGKSIKPVDLKPRKTRALRKRLNKHEESLKSLKTIRREQKTALKNFALKA